MTSGVEAAGILGRAQRLYPVNIVAFSLMSNHYHVVVEVEDARRLARFVGYFNSNLARFRDGFGRAGLPHEIFPENLAGEPRPLKTCGRETILPLIGEDRGLRSG